MGKKRMSKAGLLLAMLFVACLFACAHAVVEAPAEPEAETILNKLLSAVQNDNYPEFIADSTPEVKARLTKEMLAKVSEQLAPRMNKGYSKTYLGELNQQGYQVYLWKLTFTEGGDDILAKLVLGQDHKVAGFWFQ